MGLPIVLAPSIGSQEDFNRSWLLNNGVGLEQGDPSFAHEWIPDWLERGWLATAAMQGYVDLPRHGTENVRRVLAGEGLVL